MSQSDFADHKDIKIATALAKHAVYGEISHAMLTGLIAIVGQTLLADIRLEQPRVKKPTLNGDKISRPYIDMAISVTKKELSKRKIVGHYVIEGPTPETGMTIRLFRGADLRRACLVYRVSDENHITDIHAHKLIRGDLTFMSGNRPRRIKTVIPG